MEHDLHDGAQNQLVAIQMKLALVREQVRAGAVATRLDELIDDADAAIDELRALAHGIYPTELRAGGLGHAVRSLATTAPISVRVIADGVGRYAPCPVSGAAAVGGRGDLTTVTVGLTGFSMTS